MLNTDNRIFVKDIHFKNAEEFLQSISYSGFLYKRFGNSFIFRGQSSDKYALLPSALRKNLYEETNPNANRDEEYYAYAASEYGQIESEAQLLFSFFKRCDNAHLFVPEVQRLRDSFPFILDFHFLLSHEKWIAKEYQEIAALAQHYGVPTRLLDWTTDINVALYFASSSVIRKRATQQEKASACFDKPDKEQNMELWALDSIIIFAEKEMALPLRFVRPRYYDNVNLAAQKGILTYWQVEKPMITINGVDIEPDLSVKRNTNSLDKQIVEYLEDNRTDERLYIYHFTIPQSAAIDLYEYAKHNNCDASTLFPGYSGVVKCMEEDDFVERLKKV